MTNVRVPVVEGTGRKRPVAVGEMLPVASYDSSAKRAAIGNARADDYEEASYPKALRAGEGEDGLKSHGSSLRGLGSRLGVKAAAETDAES